MEKVALPTRGAPGRRARRGASAASVALLAVLLAACGSTPAAARHVVGTSTVPAYPAPGSGVTPGSGTDPLATPAVEQTVTDVQSGLGAVDSGLAQVNTDLDNPQADS